MQRERLRIRTGWQRANDTQRIGVDDLDGVVVARADQDLAPSLVIVMPRGRCPTGTVSTVFIWSRSTTLMVLSRSFDT